MIWNVNNPEQEFQKAAYAVFENWINSESGINFMTHDKDMIYTPKNLIKLAYFIEDFDDLQVLFSELENEKAKFSELTGLKFTLNLFECECPECTEEKESMIQECKDIEETNI